MKTKILFLGLLISGAAIANCPEHQTVTYSCAYFQGKVQCSWNPSGGWYQGSANHGDVPIPPGSQADQFLRAFWTPNARITAPGQVSYGVTICQYLFRKQLIVLYQQDHDPNISDPRRNAPELWFLSEWQGVKGYSCGASESQCHFDYGESV
jgi:hypothetical protein